MPVNVVVDSDAVADAVIVAVSGPRQHAAVVRFLSVVCPRNRILPMYNLFSYMQVVVTVDAVAVDAAAAVVAVAMTRSGCPSPSWAV